ncbi:hypothetical protein VP01_4510g1 [Puccinia sorghi]|uniref:Uncharacterized protein n=1 Tax=Puccinia sorghi TaxID=27349 RepID=A0A0L6UP07_9BASI|nr:hypothetical protein VP01_4510g1 [Puccinia sorghi]
MVVSLCLYLIDFFKSNGIIELLWKTTQFKHQTTKAHNPFNIETKILGLILVSLSKFNLNLANMAMKLEGDTPEHLADSTFFQQQRYRS